MDWWQTDWQWLSHLTIIIIIIVIIIIIIIIVIIIIIIIIVIIIIIIQRASEASEADYQSCSIEISDIYKYVYVRQNISPALLIT